MRIGHDLLAATARLASGRRVGQDRPSDPREASRGRPDRLFACGRRQHERSCSFWGAKTGPNPTDRGKRGSKHHLAVDANGIPLAVRLTAANKHDVTELLPLVDAIEPVKGGVGRPRRRPSRVCADKAYDSRRHRRELRLRHIEPKIPKRGVPEPKGLGTYRWVVERTQSWLHQFRRLRVRYEKRDDIHEAFLALGIAIICHQCLNRSFC